MAHFDCSFTSYVLDRDVEIGVVIPSRPLPGTIVGEKTHRVAHKYPVLILLHGGGNNYQTWFRYTPIERYAEERNIAVVTVSGENSGFEDTDSGLPMGTFLEVEVLDFITANFPVSKESKDHYIAGLSMGGHGILFQVLKNPENFAAFGMFSSGANEMVPIPEGFKVGDTMDWGDPVMPKVRERVTEITNNREKFPDAYIAVGGKDFLYPCSKALAEFLEENGFRVTFDTIAEYAHEWEFWEIEVRRFLDWLPRTDWYYQQAPIRRI